VKQIVRNLVVNAERYGGPGRRMVVEGSGASAVLEVRDDGPPIPHEEHERIFEPYERGEDRPGVTAAVGLGLAVSRRLAILMEGDLSYGHDGESVFRLSLPSADRSELPRMGVASRV
jgi:signal transduction histidine kinase